MRNKAKNFPNPISFDGKEADNADANASKRPDGSINDRPKERMSSSNHFKTF
ncbi:MULTISPECIES: small acid-soluble spore protein K [Shouchella]|uniref:Small, acid-soluble spore protein K n=3 Tax=Bacillaceae TaxID=186817 RepID=A0A060M144_9BACI|nr:MULTISPECIES: small acid-soluble spore protein K [Bacillaceae]RQW22027.1 small, acid-soluble spore protein K [Bacillus sp. C1-1]AIC93804.1 small acid-soluble spore protein [Shouchella lehensis G1]KQL59077.1 small, acid-soluble spore protein K [Alkalicoccobacillus plakortidis]MBG9782524.1 spore protein [Shouchella lehensis]TES47868.1 small, acid-soluble spore protein K [Shouchella lehensis]